MSTSMLEQAKIIIKRVDNDRKATEPPKNQNEYELVGVDSILDHLVENAIYRIKISTHNYNLVSGNPGNDYSSIDDKIIEHIIDVLHDNGFDDKIKDALLTIQNELNECAQEIFDERVNDDAYVQETFREWNSTNNPEEEQHLQECIDKNNAMNVLIKDIEEHPEQYDM